MFTGLIKTQGTIRRVDQRGDCMVTIALREPFAIAVGDSICCQGICLTAVKVSDNEFKVSLSAETMNRSTAKHWAVGTVLNIEPSLAVGDALGGHFVSGHVDGVARAIAAEKNGDSTIWEFEVPPHLAKFIAPKGSVTLDGVSLTVNQVKDSGFGIRDSGKQESTPISHPLASEVPTLGMLHETRASLNPESRILNPSFTVNIIPHTAKVTSFANLNVGADVNLEIDMLARYVARLAGNK